MRQAGLAQSRSKCRSPRDAPGLPSWGHRAGGEHGQEAGAGPADTAGCTGPQRMGTAQFLDPSPQRQRQPTSICSARLIPSTTNTAMPPPPNPPRNPPAKPMTGEPQICALGPWAFGTAPPHSPSLWIAALCPRGGLQPRAPRDAGGLEEAPGTCLPASVSRMARPCRAIPSCLGLMPHLVAGSGSWGPRGRFNSWCICRADRAQ